MRWAIVPTFFGGGKRTPCHVAWAVARLHDDVALAGLLSGKTPRIDKTTDPRVKSARTVHLCQNCDFSCIGVRTGQSTCEGVREAARMIRELDRKEAA